MTAQKLYVGLISVSRRIIVQLTQSKILEMGFPSLKQLISEKCHFRHLQILKLKPHQAVTKSLKQVCRTKTRLFRTIIQDIKNAEIGPQLEHNFICVLAQNYTFTTPESLINLQFSNLESEDQGMLHFLKLVFPSITNI